MAESTASYVPLEDRNGTHDSVESQLFTASSEASDGTGAGGAVAPLYTKAELDKQERRKILLRWLGNLFGGLAGIIFGALFPLGIFALNMLPLSAQIILAGVVGIPAVLLEIYIMSGFVGDCFEKFYDTWLNRKLEPADNLSKEEKRSNKIKKAFRTILLPIILVNAAGTFILIFSTFNSFLGSTIGLTSTPSIVIAVTCGLIMFVGSFGFNYRFVLAITDPILEHQKEESLEAEAAEKKRKANIRLNIVSAIGLFAGLAVCIYTMASFPDLTALIHSPSAVFTIAMAFLAPILIVQLSVAFSSFRNWWTNFTNAYDGVTDDDDDDVELSLAKKLLLATKALFKKQSPLVLKAISESIFTVAATFTLGNLANNNLGWHLSTGAMIGIGVAIAVCVLFNQISQLYKYDFAADVAKEKGIDPDENDLEKQNKWYSRVLLSLSTSLVSGGLAFTMFGLQPLTVILAVGIGFLIPMITQALDQVASSEKLAAINFADGTLDDQFDYQEFMIPSAKFNLWLNRKLSVNSREERKPNLFSYLMPKTNNAKVALSATFLAAAFGIAFMAMGSEFFSAVIPHVGMAQASMGLQIFAVIATAVAVSILPHILMQLIEKRAHIIKAEKFEELSGTGHEPQHATADVPTTAAAFIPYAQAEPHTKAQSHVDGSNPRQTPQLA